MLTAPRIHPYQGEAGLCASLPDHLLHHIPGSQKTVVEAPGYDGLGVGLNEAVEGDLPALLGRQVEGGRGDGGRAGQAGHCHLKVGRFPVNEISLVNNRYSMNI